MISTIVGLVSGLVVTAICILLVLHPEYEDGLIGRIGLSLIALASMSRLLGSGDALLHGNYVNLSPIAITLWCGLALFMSRHLYNFLKAHKSSSWRTIRK